MFFYTDQPERLESAHYSREMRTKLSCSEFLDNSNPFSIYLCLPQAELSIKITAVWKKKMYWLERQGE